MAHSEMTPDLRPAASPSTARGHRGVVVRSVSLTAPARACSGSRIHGTGRALSGVGEDDEHDDTTKREPDAEGSFDAIVSDLVMPGMSGVDLLKSVRERDHDVPIVIFTGRPAVESAITAVECGALRYLVKPVLPQELRETR